MTNTLLAWLFDKVSATEKIREVKPCHGGATAPPSFVVHELPRCWEQSDDTVLCSQQVPSPKMPVVPLDVWVGGSSKICLKKPWGEIYGNGCCMILWLCRLLSVHTKRQAPFLRHETAGPTWSRSVPRSCAEPRVKHGESLYSMVKSWEGRCWIPLVEMVDGEQFHRENSPFFV
jgi:hypothetical protein